MSNPGCGVEGAQRPATLTPDEVLVADGLSIEDALGRAERQAAEAASLVDGLHRGSRFAWGVTAVVAVVAASALLVMGASVSRLAADAQAQQALAAAANEEAHRLRDQLTVLQREHAVAEHRATVAEADAEQARARMAEQLRTIAQLEAQKQQADQALQAALSSLYVAQPKPPTTAAVPTE